MNQQTQKISAETWLEEGLQTANQKKMYLECQREEAARCAKREERAAASSPSSFKKEVPEAPSNFIFNSLVMGGHLDFLNIFVTSYICYIGPKPAKTCLPG